MSRAEPVLVMSRFNGSARLKMAQLGWLSHFEPSRGITRPNYTRPPPDLVNGEEEYEVEKIIDMKQMGRRRKMYYLVKWKGYPTSDNSWEPRENIHAEELIKEFQIRNSRKQRKP